MVICQIIVLPWVMLGCDNSN